MAPKQSKSGLIVIFLTVFLDLVGFGIIIPLSPYLARQFSASPFQIGFLMAIYSLMQFVFSPFWGGLSDRVGRRPVILISLLGGMFSYLIFAFSSSILMLFIARGLAGVFGGNISAAHAYIADITPAHERSKGMGLLGAAFGLGFIFGPLLGGALGVVGQHIGSEPPFGLSFSALGAAGLCLANFLFAWKVLGESLPPEKRKLTTSSNVGKRRRVQEIITQLRRPVVGSLIFVFFLSGLAMAQMESMLFPFVADVFHWDLKTASLGFAYIGILMVFTQGYLIRKWMPILGEPKVLSIGLLLFSISLFAIPGSTTVALIGVTMTVLGVGNGMMRPPTIGAISLLTPDHEQGAVMGVTNSIASLGRILGPLIGGYIYEHMSRGAPFFLAGTLGATALCLVLVEYKKLPSTGRN